MTKFSDLALDPRVLRAVSEAGYETPTPIQVQAIPHALEGRDVLGIAQTGTGKTASFVLPMVTHLAKGRARARMPRSLVLCPTRELAAQVAENFEKYSRHVKLSMALLIGGVSFKDQDKLIDRGVDVLIATPGRLLDHFERGKLMLTGVQIMVVDEADRMLDMGFIPDIERIFKLVPFTRQTLFFSATMAPEITRITQEFLHNPVRVEVARQATASETIAQLVCKHTPKRKDTGPAEKREVLRRLIRAEGEALTNGIIFCNRKVDVDILAKSLRQHGFDAAPLHGDLDQSMRMRILGRFRDGELKLLIASDVAARGLDIPSVSHVFNFDVPIHSEDYVHRIGRTGRAGRSGKSITLCLPHEEKYLAKIEELVKQPIPVMESPLGNGEAPASEDTAAPERRRSERGRRDPRREPRPVESRPVENRSGESRSGESRPNEGRSAESRAAEPSRVVESHEPASSEPRRGRGGRGAGGADLPGMGDHVPAFLLRQFRFDPEPETATRTEAEPEMQPAAEAPEAAPMEAAAPVLTPVEALAAEPAEAEAPEPPAAPAKKPRAPRRRTPKAAPADEVPSSAA
ncbi:DEAD/DEAH box helicase [uncultured Amaricoccus sp.]|uniref:DEAD/DEAH box helicase n=1 Tax=uncultured Amaricoccus sp. TaxID=339341 RepID=UPI0026131998|nr:DEAD/DEAH box helicase [uncultured Amaricoccus sp.]